MNLIRFSKGKESNLVGVDPGFKGFGVRLRSPTGWTKIMAKVSLESPSYCRGISNMPVGI
ncbi:hypothetical protein [Sphingobacterium mizutaii]|uniref:hypothetical protein n=1 Tax=Sphingobacterium mizutaii TaxID=1010 RepID=UPI00289E8459|nr:hypothetical protein [Sphingobacterium mizutaii]